MFYGYTTYLDSFGHPLECQIGPVNDPELQETPGYQGLDPISHSHQPIKTGFTRLKPLSPV
jgi:hypothetical protein